MKKYVRFIALLTALLLLLSGCGQPTFPLEEEIEFFPTTAYAPVAAEHGEDYVIQWEDAGMEAHIRFLLDKPEGGILHSDVWDIQELAFRGNYAEPYDEALIESPGGADISASDSPLARDIEKRYGDRTFPMVQSLRDLRHFDSLQILSVYFKILDAGLGDLSGLTDISGLEECKYLKSVYIANARPESLEPLAELPMLKVLSLRYCGQLDLTPLEKLPSLVAVTLDESELLSLEPLTKLPALQYLSLGGATFPSLEPLTRTTVQNLDMGQSGYDKKLHKGLDYEPLSRIPNLQYLDLTNHGYVDVEVCEAILENCKDLIYLDVSYTKAGTYLKWGLAELDVSNLKGFRYG